MKITIEPETKEEKNQFSEKRVYVGVFEFGITGRFTSMGFEKTFSHLHVADKYILYGKLMELRERLKDG